MKLTIKKLITIVSILFFVSCTEVRYKAAQPKGVKSIKSFPEEMRGSYLVESYKKDKYIIIGKKSYKYVNLSSDKNNREGELGKSAVLKKYEGKYFLSIKSHSNMEYWNSGYFTVGFDKLNLFVIKSKGVKVVKKAIEYDSLKDLITINPSKKELMQLINSGAFEKENSFSKKGIGNMEESFKADYKLYKAKKDKEKSKGKEDDIKRAKKLCNSLDDVLDKNKEELKNMPYGHKFLDKYTAYYGSYSNTYKITFTDYTAAKLFSYKNIVERLKGCGYKVVSEKTKSTSTKYGFIEFEKGGKKITLDQFSTTMSYLKIYMEKEFKAECISGDCKNGFGEKKLKKYTYKGNFKNGVFHGNGTMNFDNGNKYVGNYTNGLREGQGVYMYANGSKYTGNYENGEMQGKGTFNFKTGSKYVGNFQAGSKHGFGIEYRKDGSKYYEGNWFMGKFSGTGTMYYKKGGKYVGDFKKGKREGLGKEYSSATGKLSYEGGWKYGKLHGKGKAFYNSGESFKGSFSYNKKTGYGESFDKNGNMIYKGNYKNNYYHGSGTQYFKDGSKYVGSFKDGKRSYGTYYDKNGNKK